MHAGPAYNGREHGQGEVSIENLRVKHQRDQIRTIKFSRQGIEMDEERKPKPSSEAYIHIPLKCPALF